MKLKPTINDVIPDITSGIFSALANLNVPWETDASILDLDYMGNISGQKTISPLVSRVLGDNTTLTSENITQLANVIYALNGTRWTKLFATLLFDYNPISNYDMTETERSTGTTEHTTTHTGTQTTENSNTVTGNGTVNNSSGIYGFNSSTSSGDTDGTTTTSNSHSATGEDTRTDDLTDEDNGTHTDSRTLTRSGNIGVTTSQQMIQSERDLWLWNYFYNIVFPDVDKVLTVSTYSNR